MWLFRFGWFNSKHHLKLDEYHLLDDVTFFWTGVCIPECEVHNLIQTQLGVVQILVIFWLAVVILTWLAMVWPPHPKQLLTPGLSWSPGLFTLVKLLIVTLLLLSPSNISTPYVLSLTTLFMLFKGVIGRSWFGSLSILVTQYLVCVWGYTPSWLTPVPLISSIVLVLKHQLFLTAAVAIGIL